MVGIWEMTKHNIELKEGDKLYHDSPYQVSKSYEKALRKEIDRLVKIGVLRKVDHSQ